MLSRARPDGQVKRAPAHTQEEKPRDAALARRRHGGTDRSSGDRRRRRLRRDNPRPGTRSRHGTRAAARRPGNALQEGRPHGRLAAGHDRARLRRKPQRGRRQHAAEAPRLSRAGARRRDLQHRHDDGQVLRRRRHDDEGRDLPAGRRLHRRVARRSDGNGARPGGSRLAARLRREEADRAHRRAPGAQRVTDGPPRRLACLRERRFDVRRHAELGRRQRPRPAGRAAREATRR